MAWKKNRAKGLKDFPDLQYVPRDRCGWDTTLSALAYGARREIEGGKPDLAAWAARHGLPPSARARSLGDEVAVLWHGTSRARAEKIAEHGLFSKGGLWTTSDPFIAHSFTRGRSERFAIEGAMVCLVMDRRQYEHERDFAIEGAGKIFRFHRGLPPELVEYVLFHEEARFFGPARAKQPARWPSAKLKRREGKWAPAQKAPVRYSDAASYSTVREFAELCVDRLLSELGEVAAIEVFSTLYALISPWDALEHAEVFDVIDEKCVARRRRRSKVPTFRARVT